MRSEIFATWFRRLKEVQIWNFNRADCAAAIRMERFSVLAAFGLLLVWNGLAPSSAAVFGLLAFGLLIGAAYAWAREMAVHVQAERRLRFVAFQVGDELEEIVKLHNASWLPVIWSEYLDSSNLPGYELTSAYAAGSRSSVEWRVHTICSRRGVFSLGPWQVILGDPLGIFRVRLTYFIKKEILVYPPLAALPPAILPHRTAVGELRPMRQPLAAETIQAFTTRPFQSGDALRHIHWRATARHGKPFVKVFEPEATSTVWLVADFDASVHFGGGEQSSLEKLVILAASLTKELLRQRQKVGLLAFSQKMQVCPPQPGLAHLWDVLNLLSPLQADPKQRLADTIEQARPLIRAQDLLFILTPSLDADWANRLHEIRSGGVEALLLETELVGGPAGCQAFVTWLSSTGLPARYIQLEEIQPVQGAFGKVGSWDFKILGTGRALLRKAPHAVSESLGNV